MKLFRGLSLVCVLGTMVVNQQALAWGDMGHETVGEIAEQILSKDPATMRAIQAVIGVEPLYMSAVWPDQARSDERFDDFALYHFYSVPEPGKKEPEKSARTILAKYPNILLDKEVPRDTKMIAYRYLVHVVGDMHQPLHAGFASDAGGNACAVKWQPDAKVDARNNNLHSVWDTAMVEHLGRINKVAQYTGFRDLAKMLINKYPEIVAAEADVDFDTWIRESHALVKSDAYPDRLDPKARRYCTPRGVKAADEDIPVLDAKFVDSRLPIVEKRLILGGVRLAAFLKKIFVAPPAEQKPQYLILKMLKVTESDKANDGHKHD